MCVSRPQTTQAGRFLWTVTAPHPAHPKARMPFAQGDGSHGRAEPRPGRTAEQLTARLTSRGRGPGNRHLAEWLRRQ